MKISCMSEKTKFKDKTVLGSEVKVPTMNHNVPSLHAISFSLVSFHLSTFNYLSNA